MSKRHKFGHAPRRQQPDQPVSWPFEADVVAEARWPARNWPLRRAAARPIRVAARLLRQLAGRAEDLVDLVEGQPLVQVYWQEGWHHSMRLPKTVPYQYSGLPTVEIIAMYQAHPERFADSDLDIIIAYAAQMRGRE